MAHFDLSLDELRTWTPDLSEPDGFDDFWGDTLDEIARADLDVTIEQVDNRLTTIDTFDVTFTGFGGTRVRAWLHLPAGATGPLPTVVQYHGYSGGRGMPLNATFAAAGYVHLQLDTRGQGWRAPSVFDTTPDDDADAGLPSVPGFMTRGVLSPTTYYYRRLMVDCVRILQVAAAHGATDERRIVVTGASQGGGLAIATAGLAPRVGIELAGCAPDVPFLCHVRRGVELCGVEPYAEIERYLATFPQQIDQVYWTLSHFDGVHFATRMRCPALFSVGLMDEVCPPSTVFAAYNRVPGTKDINVYPYNGHEGGGDLQVWAKLGWLRDLLG